MNRLSHLCGRLLTVHSIMAPLLWIPARIGLFEFHLLNLDHPDIERLIMEEIDSGIDVYYDRRWDATEAFAYFLSDNQWIRNRRVLVLGAGVGMETLVIGKLSSWMYLNDLAPKALELCSRQLRENGILNFELLPGRFETLTCPPVDIVIGCYLVYNPETLKAMASFLAACSYPVLLMNETLPAFEKLIRKTKKKISSIPCQSPFQCILFEDESRLS